MALVIFDLDNTLLSGDSDHQWGQYLVDKGYVDAAWYEEKNDYFYQQYTQGILNIVEYSAFAFTPLAKRSMKELAIMHHAYMKEYIQPIISNKSKALIQWHKDKGDTLLVITATNRFVVEPIIKAYQIEHFLATEPKIVKGRYTTEIEGVACFQQGKIIRLKEWLLKSDETLAESIFYSDSFNDLPLLELVDKAIAVDPDESLSDIAIKNGWRVISLRD